MTTPSDPVSSTSAHTTPTDADARAAAATSASKSNPGPVRRAATLVREVGEKEARYDMFTLCEISAHGATLAGALLLEMDEMFRVEFASDDGERLCVSARVVRRLRDLPGIEVAFSGLDETLQKRIAGLARSEA